MKKWINLKFASNTCTSNLFLRNKTRQKVYLIKATMGIKPSTILGLISDILKVSTVVGFSRDCSGAN
jgi:hypothetical protein